MIVVDNSIFIAWCMSDEEDPTALEAIRHISEEGVVVPRIWWYEFRNVLLANERRRRISSQQVSRILSIGFAPSLEFDENHDEAQLFSFARQFDLTVYDAAYMEVAFRRNLPLATLDHRLRKAADAIGIAMFHHHD